jgi:lipid-A-disaccharide synthase
MHQRQHRRLNRHDGFASCAAGCSPAKLLEALRDVLSDSSMRRRQLEGFAKIDQIMSTGNQSASAWAADIVLATLRKARRSG